ncbi:MBL fold metallo-hydrolase [Phreatobacter sp.]|uniref:MBL fold metallo-hydrolase n=1 Tax=Phreatobacter sp. TaxID=1966341 RepID=UPI003F6EBEB1
MPSRRTLLGLLAGLPFLGGLAAYAAERRPFYTGPLSDHFDGTRFFDPHGSPPKAFTDLLRWQFGGDRRASWPASWPGPGADRPPPRVDDDSLRLSYVGHASVMLQTRGLNILFDPVWSERVSPVSFAGPKRVNAPGIAFEDLPKIDLVLVSHGHYDHLDVSTLSRLHAAHAPRVITPLGQDLVMKGHDPAIRAEAHDWGARLEVGNGVAVHLAPMRHWSARGLFDRNKALWAAFVLEMAAGHVYHIGDTGYGDGHHFREARRRFGGFRLAILPIGAYEPRWFMRDQHMNPDEAVQVMIDSGARRALAHHWGTVQLTNEGIEEPRDALVQALAARAIDRDRFRALRPGEVWSIGPDEA